MITRRFLEQGSAVIVDLLFNGVIAGPTALVIRDPGIGVEATTRKLKKILSI